MLLHIKKNSWPYIEADKARLIKRSSCNPLVSLIVPAYNADIYIEQCLGSIKKQTLFDIEIIFIDDGSTDNTFEKAFRLIGDDDRVTILQTNSPSGSPGFGRNLGMVYARANYLMFVDADDWLDENVVEQLYKTIENDKSDICFLSGFFNHFEENVNKRFYKKNYVGVDGDFRGFHESFMLWDKIYRRDFLKENDIFVGLSKASEEILFIIKAYFYAKKSSVSIGNYGYHYRRWSISSITKNIRKKIYPSYEIDAWKPVHEWAKKNEIGSDYEAIILLRKILSLSYANSIIDPIYEKRFIKDISEVLPSKLSEKVIRIANILGYEMQINNFYKKIKSLEKEKNENKKNIIFGPNWSSSNPYQKLLYDALSMEYGVCATGFSPKQLSEKYLIEKREGNSVLHLHWLHPFYDPASQASVKLFLSNIKAAKKIGYRIFWTAHNILPHDIKKDEECVHKFVRQEVLNLVDAVIVHDKNSISDLRKLFKVNKQKIYIVPHGLYEVKGASNEECLKLRQEFGFDKNDIVLLTPGRIRAYKGVEKIARFFLSHKDSINRNIKYIVAGAPDDKFIDEELKVISSKVSNFKYLPGVQSDERLRCLFGISDLCLLPYERGMTSGVAYLSLSYGVPLITSSLTMFDVFKEEGISISVDSEYWLNAINYIALIVGNGDKAALFPALNKDKYLSKYSWSELVKLRPYSDEFGFEN